MKTLLITLFLIFAGLYPANFIFAAEPMDIVISEIAWMGTETSFADEWIELYNNTTSTIDITNWTLKSSDESPSITFKTKIGQKIYSGHSEATPVNFSIPASGFYLLERTDDDTVMDIPADYIYTGALNNNGETLELSDAQGNLIDAANFTDGWLFGNNTTKQTMERKNLLLTANPNNWQTSAIPHGTPLAQNSSPEESESEQNNDNLSITNDQLSIINNQSNNLSSPEPQTIKYPNGVVINEILPSPDGPDAENEWIEIFNQNNFSVNISNWEITDTQGKTKSYFFPRNTIIKAKSFLLFPRPQTKITLNNDADGLNLIHPNKTITDSVIYTKAKLNQSYNKNSKEWIWSDTLTPGWENIILNATDDIVGDIDDVKENSVPNAEKIYKGHSEATTVTVKPIHFTASLLALFSAFSILALKRSLNKR
jgi:hypothetical protein